MWGSALLIGLLVLAGCAAPEGMTRKDYFGFRNHVPEQQRESLRAEAPLQETPAESRLSRSWNAPLACPYTVIVPEWGYADWYAPWYGVPGCCAGYGTWCWHVHGWYSSGWRCYYGYRRCTPPVVVVVPAEVVRPAVRSVRTFGPQRGSVEQWREERENAGSTGGGGRRRLQGEQGAPTQSATRAEPVAGHETAAEQARTSQGGRRRLAESSESGEEEVVVRTGKRSSEDGGRAGGERIRQGSLSGSKDLESSGGGRSRPKRRD